MHYAIEVVPLGDYADPRNILRLAKAADAAGWEGLFVWDHLGYVWGAAASDPWVSLAAVAAVTTHLKVGVAVSPLPRYQPHVLARTLVSLDLLSSGRLILGAGLGAIPEEFTVFGGPGDTRQRAGMLDENLALLEQFFSGEPVNHRGEYYIAEGITFTPLPLQRPRFPIWIGGESRAGLRRAARWDGWIAGTTDEHGQITKSPEALAEQAVYIQEHRTSEAPFDIALSGYTEPGQSDLPQAYAQAGCTWWLESLHGYRGSVDEMLARVIAGPPNSTGQEPPP